MDGMVVAAAVTNWSDTQIICTLPGAQPDGSPWPVLAVNASRG